MSDSFATINAVLKTMSPTAVRVSHSVWGAINVVGTWTVV